MRKQMKSGRLLIVVALALSLLSRSGTEATQASQASCPGITDGGNQLWEQMQSNREEYRIITSGQVTYKIRGDDFGTAVATGDFNRDGFADLAIGVPGEDADIQNVENQTPYDQLDLGKGAVNVIYGRAYGLHGMDNQIFRQGSNGVFGVAELRDGFGAALAVGDFNRDGYDDLAIGVPGDRNDKGGVNTIFGSASGLNPISQQLWNQDSDGIEGVAEAGDRFGAALAAGDFNKDGYDDLAIGVPGEDGGAGAVAILYTPNHLSGTVDQLWQQSGCSGCVTPGKLKGAAEADDLLGSSLTVGDFNGDTVDDLAIGVPGELISGKGTCGAVAVLYGNSALVGTYGLHDLNGPSDQEFYQGNAGIAGQAAGGEKFGFALAAGDFNRDGADDLAIGVPMDFNGASGGAVNIIYGSRIYNGLHSAGNRLIRQGADGVAGASEYEDLFGRSLSAGDFNGDGHEDLAVGAPGEDTSKGAVNIIYGGPSGIQPGAGPGNHLLQQGNGAIGGDAEEGDRLGWALAAGNFNSAPAFDLAIGAPGENNHAGAVNVLYGSPNLPPVANPGGPYVVDACASPIPLNGLNSTDPNQPGSMLYYQWDLDGDGIFGETGLTNPGVEARAGDEVGPQPTFSPGGLSGLNFINGQAQHTIRLKVVDLCGLSSTTQTVITVLRPLPSISAPDSVSRYTDPGQCSTRVDFTVTACPNVQLSVTPPSGSLFPKGQSYVNVTARNSAGQVVEQRTIPINVYDIEPPVITCPADITVKLQPGQCEASVNITKLPRITDNCGVQWFRGYRSDYKNLSQPFPKGVTTITWQARDTSSNLVTCQQRIIVEGECQAGN